MPAANTNKSTQCTSELQTNPSHDNQPRPEHLSWRTAFSKPASYNPKEQGNNRRFQAPHPCQSQVPFPSKAGHPTPPPFPSGTGHSMHYRPSNQWRAPSFEHRPTTNRGNAPERRETQPVNNPNCPKRLMTIKTGPPLQPLQTSNTVAMTLRQNTQQQCQLCLGFNHIAVTYRRNEPAATATRFGICPGHVLLYRKCGLAAGSLQRQLRDVKTKSLAAILNHVLMKSTPYYKRMVRR